MKAYNTRPRYEYSVKFLPRASSLEECHAKVRLSMGVFCIFDSIWLWILQVKKGKCHNLSKLQKTAAVRW